VLVYIKLLLTAVFWAGTFIAGKVVTREMLPFSAAFVRFTIASVFLILITFRFERSFPRMRLGQIASVLFLGMTGILAYNVFFFKGLKLIEAGRASLVIATCPVFITIFSSAIFKERVNLKQVFGIFISVLGAAVVISKGQLVELLRGNVGYGEMFIFGCVLCWTAYTIVGKTLMKVFSPIIVVTYSSLVGTAGLLVPAIFEGILGSFSGYSASAWIGVFYLGIFGTVLGFIWYYDGVKRIGPIKAGLFINFIPIAAVLLAFFILGEAITISLLVGAILVIFGVLLVTLAGK